jgi:methionine synthase I (cobalamin-dependent)
LKNNNDILNLTQPEKVLEVHEAYLLAGADIIETNTFNGQCISQSDYGLQDLSFEINKEAARIARMAADRVTAADNNGVWRLVAGAVGPTNRTCSVSPKVEDPAYRNVTYMEIKDAYKEQIRGLVEGGGKLIIYILTSIYSAYYIH